MWLAHDKTGNGWAAKSSEGIGWVAAQMMTSSSGWCGDPDLPKDAFVALRKDADAFEPRPSGSSTFGRCTLL